jgi:hypothetical protein
MKPAQKPTKYPFATVIAYGPDNTRATKLVVAVYKTPAQQTAATLHRWIINEGEIRHDPVIAEEVAAFLKQEGVKETISYDRIIGCPHEEGIDYPMGRTCPCCPFWAGIDRFTHEPIKLPPPTRSPEQILAELSELRDTQPLEALASADAHREALIEPLLQAIERGLANPTGLPEGEGMLFSYATYLLAKWREPRAYPYFIRWLVLPGEAPFDIGGDTVTQEGSRFLASVFDGDLEPLKAMILNRAANEYSRSAAVGAMSLLAVWGEVSRQTVEDCFLWLAREGLEREFNHVWNALASSCADLEALRVFPELRRAFDEGLIERGFMRPEELAEVEAGPRGKWIERERERHPPIADVAAETSWWQCFKRDRRLSARELAELARQEAVEPVGAEERPTPVVRSSPKIGRNDPCPCGSGKKFKKCCGA